MEVNSEEILEVENMKGQQKMHLDPVPVHKCNGYSTVTDHPIHAQSVVLPRDWMVMDSSPIQGS